MYCIKFSCSDQCHKQSLIKHNKLEEQIQNPDAPSDQSDLC